MNNAFVLQDLASFAEIIANVGLLFNPVDVTRNAFAEVNVRSITGGPRQRGVTREVPHFAGTKFAVHLWRDIDFQNFSKLLRDVADWCATRAADVYGHPVDLLGSGSPKICVGD